MIRDRWLLISLFFTGVILLVFMMSPLLYGACPAGCNKACCATKATPEATKVEDAEIDTPALKTLMRAKVSMVILDARGPQKTRIVGAVPMSVKADDAAILKTVPDKETLVVTYCGGPQCPLSTMLAKRLHGLGYKNVLEYGAGIRGWTASAGKVETTK